MFAGYDAGASNTYFEIQDNTSYDLTNLVFTAVSNNSDTTSPDYGWSDSWNVANVSAGNFAVDYFTGTQAFQTDFPANYANTNVTPADLTYELSGLVQGQAFQISFNGGDGFSGPAFLGLDFFGNATNASDFGQVGTFAVAAVPTPGAITCFLLGVLTLRASHRKTRV